MESVKLVCCSVLHEFLSHRSRANDCSHQILLGHCMEKTWKHIFGNIFKFGLPITLMKSDTVCSGDTYLYTAKNEFK